MGSSEPASTKASDEV